MAWRRGSWPRWTRRSPHATPHGSAAVEVGRAGQGEVRTPVNGGRRFTTAGYTRIAAWLDAVGIDRPGDSEVRTQESGCGIDRRQHGQVRTRPGAGCTGAEFAGAARRSAQRRARCGAGGECARLGRPGPDKAVLAACRPRAEPPRPRDAGERGELPRQRASVAPAAARATRTA